MSILHTFNKSMAHEFSNFHTATFPSNELSASYILNALNDNYKLQLLLLNGSLVGYVITLINNTFTHIEYIAVKKEHNGKGYAKLMIDALKTCNKVITLECCSYMKLFYEKHNFWKSRETVDKYDFMIYGSSCDMGNAMFNNIQNKHDKMFIKDNIQ